MAQIDLTREAPDRSIGELVAEAAGEVSTLVRKELELAKAELKEDVAAVGKGAGAFGAAAFAGYLALLFLSLAAMFGLATVLPTWAAALVVAGCYLVAAGVAALVGKASFARMTGLPRTTRTIKEDVEWARHPSS